MTSPVVCVSARLDILPERLDTALQALKPLVAATRLEDGCLQYDAHQCLDDPGRILIFERWASKAHLDAHVARPHLAAFIATVTPCVRAEPETLLWTTLD